MRTMQRVMRRSKAPGKLRLSERITQLEAALADAHARVSEYERARELVPEQLRVRVQRLEADVGWLRELDSLRAITRGIVSGDHEAISRGLVAALEEELLLRTIHASLTRLAKKGQAS